MPGFVVESNHNVDNILSCVSEAKDIDTSDRFVIINSDSNIKIEIEFDIQISEYNCKIGLCEDKCHFNLVRIGSNCEYSIEYITHVISHCVIDEAFDEYPISLRIITMVIEHENRKFQVMATDQTRKNIGQFCKRDISSHERFDIHNYDDTYLIEFDVNIGYRSEFMLQAVQISNVSIVSSRDFINKKEIIGAITLHASKFDPLSYYLLLHSVKGMLNLSLVHI